MKLLNLNNPQDLMALLVRRKWWIVIPFFGLSCAAVLLTYMLPKMYVSTALILVQPRDVPDEIVKDALAGSTEQRLSAIKEAVLSRTSLIDILREFDNSLPEFQALNLDQKVESLRNQIEIDPDSGRAPVTYFRISFRSRNPETTQKIAEKLTAVFIDKDNQVRETKVDTATSFVAAELEKISRDLDASNTKLKNLKALRRDSLPDQTPANLANLDRLEQRRSADSAQMGLLQTRLTTLEQFIISTQKEIPGPTPVAVPVGAPPVAEKNPLVDEYLTVQAHRTALIARGATEKHPDVLIDTNNLERLKKLIPPDVLKAAMKPKEVRPVQAAPVVPMVANPAYLTYMGEKANVEKEIEVLKDRIADAEKNINGYEKRVQNAPQSAQELQDVQRENDELNKRYQEMSDSLNKAKISQSLETRQQSSPLRIADPANYPLSPTKPSKPAIAGVGVMLSLLIGMALAVIVDVANQKMWTLSEVEALLGTTVLVEIPEIVTPSDLDETKRKRKIYLASFTVLSAAYGFCLYLAYVHQGFVLKHLEPVIKRLY